MRFCGDGLEKKFERGLSMTGCFELGYLPMTEDMGVDEFAVEVGRED